MLKLETPAKINLILEVLSKREDGYHNVRTILQAIDLCDTFEFREDSALKVSCNMEGWQAEESLIPKAARLLQEATGCKLGADIRIKKKIPLMSGLGGDSSDAAVTLLGLNILWDLHLPRWHLLELAAELGSDVPFFIYGGTALGEGRGEVVTPLPSFLKRWVVLLIPKIKNELGKTSTAYKKLKVPDYTNGDRTDEFLSRITKGKDLPDSIFHNVFETVAYSIYKELDMHRWVFLEAGAHQVAVSGSGPTLYSIFKDKAQAEKVYKKLEAGGFNTFLVQTRGINRR